MRAEFKSILTSPLMATLLYRLVRTYCLTFRLEVENEQPWLDYLDSGGRVLLCCWHQQFFSLIRHCEKYRPYRPSLMISQSQDGQMIAGIAEKCGWHPVRGSSSRGGKEALKALIEKLRETCLAAHIVDGPSGPAGKIKHGVISLVHATGAVVVPMYISADRAWYFHSWDRFLVPKPFSRVVLRFGDMIRYDISENEADMKKQRQDLENIMAPHLKMQPLEQGSL